MDRFDCLLGMWQAALCSMVVVLGLLERDNRKLEEAAVASSEH